MHTVRWYPEDGDKDRPRFESVGNELAGSHCVCATGTADGSLGLLEGFSIFKELALSTGCQGVCRPAEGAAIDGGGMDGHYLCK